MDVHALATTPLFVCSLVICAVVTACAIAMVLRCLFQALSGAAATMGLRPHELEAVEHAGEFHNQFEELMEKVISLEELSTERPQLFDDYSWTRLLQLCDNLESVREELHSLLGVRDFTSAYKLGRFLSGAYGMVPDLPRAPQSLELRLVSNWQHESNELLQRMVTKVEDALSYERQSSNTSPSPEFMGILQELKQRIVRDGS